MIITFIQRAIMQSIPLLFGSTGETITEKGGNLNLGIPGIMYVGGISGVIGARRASRRLTRSSQCSFPCSRAFWARRSWVCSTAS